MAGWSTTGGAWAGLAVFTIFALFAGAADKLALAPRDVIAFRLSRLSRLGCVLGRVSVWPSSKLLQGPYTVFVRDGKAAGPRASLALDLTVLAETELPRGQSQSNSI